MLEKRLEINADDVRAHFHLAKSFSQRGDIDEAIHHAEKYIQNCKEDFNGSVYYLLISLLIKKGDIEKAEVWLNDSVQSLPMDLDIASAQVDLGVLKKRPDMVLAGAVRYMDIFDRICQDPAFIGNRSVYTFTPERNVECSMHVLFLLLNDAKRVRARLEKAIETAPDTFKVQAQKNIETILNLTGA